jgi:ABC-type iron transport system FetAB permease component
VALTAERLFADLDARSGESTASRARWGECARCGVPSLRSALRRPDAPINSMAAACIGFIPGMMTGQVLAGGPRGSGQYQIVVHLMISATPPP